MLLIETGRNRSAIDPLRDLVGIDAKGVLRCRARIAIRVATVPYRLQDADAALRALARNRVSGAAVLRIS